MKLEIEKHLVISTSHVLEDDINELLSESCQYPLVAKDTGYGVTIQVDDKDNFKLPPKENSVDFITDYKMPEWVSHFSKEFIEILRIAQENECLWVDFDRDGSTYEELPEFEW